MIKQNLIKLKMEAETIQKNGASPKSQTSRVNAKCFISQQCPNKERA
jgi:hypothetical protein